MNVLVKVYRDGLVEVYGGRHINAKIVFLGRSVTFPEHEIALEEEVNRRLPGTYKDIHYPSNRRAIGLRGAVPDDCTITVPAKDGDYEACQQEATEPDESGGALERAIQRARGEMREVPQVMPSSESGRP